MKKCRRLWYTSPAVDWETQALPIGNGMLGGMIFGGIEQETIQYNHKELWSGGPGAWEGYRLGIREGAAQHLPRIRELLAKGRVAEADEAIDTYLLGDGRAFGNYQNFGELLITHTGLDMITAYERSLNLEDGTAYVSFESKGIAYKRSYFCSDPDGVMVIRITSDQEAMQSIKIAMTCPQETVISYEQDEIKNYGQVPSNGMKLASCVKVVNEGGVCEATEDGINVSGARSITLFMTAGTDYKNEYPHYKGEDPREEVSQRLEQAVSRGYESVRTRHVEDYTQLFGRMSLEIGAGEGEDLPTDKLLEAYQTADDPELECLMFDYGRYLLIASSRAGSLPANLQGVWNNSNNPPWCCDYHFNVNLQMCYWPAEVTGLGECAIPLIEYVDALRVPGRVTAEQVFGCKGPGWVVNTMNNPFGFTAPGWGRSWGWTPSCNAWISQNLWEHYAFGRDVTYLKEKIYPIIKEAAQFWSEYLVEDEDGTLVSSPSFSSEHGETTIGATTDQVLVYELFTNVIEAGELVGEDEVFVEKLKSQRERLHPIRVGQYGQLQEWKEDIDDPEDKHRHLNHMLGFFPGRQINKNTPEAFEAGVTTLIQRGDEGTGWSRANKINLWARALDGDHAYQILQGQLRTCTHQNLFDTHPPFQIDGNFGYTSGVAEMLVQSHNEAIELLPALPKQWDCGCIEGIRARGGFGIDMTWIEGKVSALKVHSYAGEQCRLALANYKVNNLVTGEEIATVWQAGYLAFETEVGMHYGIEIL